jgi:hypothetical protein
MNFYLIGKCSKRVFKAPLFEYIIVLMVILFYKYRVILTVKKNNRIGVLGVLQITPSSDCYSNLLHFCNS